MDCGHRCGEQGFESSLQETTQGRQNRTRLHSVGKQRVAKAFLAFLVFVLYVPVLDTVWTWHAVLMVRKNPDRIVSLLLLALPFSSSRLLCPHLVTWHRPPFPFFQLHILTLLDAQSSLAGLAIAFSWTPPGNILKC